MNKILLLAACLVVAMLQGCSMERSAIRANDSRPCVSNYSTSGDFWSGKQFRTHQVFHGIPTSVVFDRVVSAIASSGRQITNTDRELGTISAVSQVISTAGKQVPFNAIVRSDPAGGVKVELVFTLTGMLTTSADAVQDNFCRVLSAVSSPQNKPPESKAAPATETPASGKQEHLPVSGSRLSIKEAQQHLVSLGYTPGAVDGQFGGKTAAALKQFQTDNGLPATSRLDVETSDLLRKKSNQGSGQAAASFDTHKQAPKPAASSDKGGVTPKEPLPVQEKKSVTDL